MAYKPGTYLVRKSRTNPDGYVLSMRSTKNVYEFPIEITA